MSDSSIDAAAPTFAPLDDRDGLEIVDPVERVRFELYTSRGVELVPAGTDQFPYPMESAVAVETARIGIPKLADVVVRDSAGEFVTDYSVADDCEAVKAGAYDLDLSTAPLKLHVLVESAVEIRKTGDTTVIDFGETTTATVGARSFHDRPAGTIMVPNDVEALMDALSLFGSALKTTSPERSFPTLRGHPPRIERGEQFRVSKGIDDPDTGVKLVLPPERKVVYAAAPLAYYLGANVVPGSWPRLVAGDFEHTFPRPSREYGWYREADDFEEAIYRTLKQVFFLDCVVRTEGLYPVDLHERNAFEERTETNLDFAALYEMPLADRLETYLEVPYGDVYPFLPSWNLMVDVVPAYERDPLLPYLIDDLALIRCTPPPEKRHLRPDDPLSIKIHGEQEPTAPPSEDNPDVHDMSYAGKTFDPAPTDALEHAHVGDGFPYNSNKLWLKAFENQVYDERDDDVTVRVHVVSNDSEIDDRGLLPAVYGDRNLLDFEVSYDTQVGKRRMSEILERPTDLVHIVSEATEDGIVCTDGVLRPIEVYPVNARAFFLERCEHLRDVRWLIDRGAFGGVATTTKIDDRDDALVVGRWMARLLNNGFTLRSAMQVIEQVFPDHLEYTIMGDGGMSISQPVGGHPFLLSIDDTLDETCEVSIETRKSRRGGLGTVWWPIIDGVSENRLAPVAISGLNVDCDALTDFFDRQLAPVNLESEWTWSDVLHLTRNL